MMEQPRMFPQSDAVGETPAPQHSLHHDTLSHPSQPATLFNAHPTYAQSHDPSLLKFPDVPTTELAPILPAPGHIERGNTLPSLSSVTGSRPHLFSPNAQDLDRSRPPPPPAAPPAWSGFSPVFSSNGGLQGIGSPSRMDIDVTSNSTFGTSSPDRLLDGRASSVSLDDPDVRLAAEALGDLRADFVSSPSHMNTPLPTASPPLRSASTRASSQEPLLSLLTTSHPFLATTIEGATSAYNSSKNYSPRFKSGAEYVEGYLTPIANTVGSVGRVTGVEGGVRWFLGGRRHHQAVSDMESGEMGSNKRRRVDVTGPGSASGGQSYDSLSSGTVTPNSGALSERDRRLSMASTIDSLPAYEDVKSVEGPAGGQRWKSRLIMSTSGLSVAMNEESLRSLKYCLRWLRWANQHIARIIDSLKEALEQLETTSATPQSEGDAVMADGAPLLPTTNVTRNGADRSELTARIASLKNDILKTLREVIDTVSKYAGGALPENARILVRRHLTSLPQRFRLATKVESKSSTQGSDAKSGEKEAAESASKVLLLAKEGLDMMAQVSGVVDGTIVSAEEWLERMGRKRREEHEPLAAQPPLPIPEKSG